MTDIPDRKAITFSQAEGISSLPSQLALGEISQELRARIWNIMYQSLGQDQIRAQYRSPIISGKWLSILQSHHVFIEHEMIDEFDNSFSSATAHLKQLIAYGTYIEIFDFVQFLTRHPSCPNGIEDKLARALTVSQAAYRLRDQTIYPVATEAEASAVSLAFANLNHSEFNGAATHLKQAGEHLTGGRWAESIWESISSVESVVRMLTSENKVSAALRALTKSGTIHGSLKEGIEKLYGYTSDEEGIRHPLLSNESAAADETDALFMFGACASFVTYLIRKGRAADLLEI